jgi:rRNA biogenesis protein RRP5
LKNYPKRSDIWLVYLDKEIKFGHHDKVRHIFEKALTIDFKVKTLKTLIKKYLEFEKENGNAKTLEHVKTLTQRLITEKLTQINDDEAEGEDNKMEVDDE